jgi:thiol-disulfide isomerase/thioredoxin
MLSHYRLAFVCLFSLFLAVPAWAEEEVPTAEDRRQFNQFYLKSRETVNTPERFETLKAELKVWLVERKIVFINIIQVGLRIAEQCGVPADEFLDELFGYIQSPDCTLSEEEKKVVTKNFYYFAEQERTRMAVAKAEKTKDTPGSFDTFKSEFKERINRKEISIYELMQYGLEVAALHKVSDELFVGELVEYIRSPECTLPIEQKNHAAKELKDSVNYIRFGQFTAEILQTADPLVLEKNEQLKPEIKKWINREISISRIVKLLIELVGHNKAEQYIKNELMYFVQSEECTLSAEEKKKTLVALNGTILSFPGNDLKLYGRMLDDKDFDWSSLRGKYVLIKFTATWCVPCQTEIPGMLEAYEKYRNNGFEIVSIYIWQREDDAVATVRQSVERAKLPWIILSETLTEKAKQPEQGDFYGIGSVPTMLLVDKEGKIVMTNARGNALKNKLAEIFE